MLSLLFVFALPATVSGGVLYTVDRQDDAVAADGCLFAVANDCSLRGAFRKAFQDSVDSLIALPAGTYLLTVDGPWTRSSPPAAIWTYSQIA